MKYPRGKLRADDHGALAFKLAIQDQTLLIVFGKPVTWLGLGVSDLERLIAGLQEKLVELRRTVA